MYTYRGVLGLVEYTEQLIDTVLGIFLVNDFEINKPVSPLKISCFFLG